jgi:uncharacterized protein (UPF0261 family)
VGTLDTKGAEYAYLRDRVTEAGVDVIVVDAGILGEPRFPADITRQEVTPAERLSAAGAVQLDAPLGASAQRPRCGRPPCLPHRCTPRIGVCRASPTT